jgi:nucleolar protein 56
VEERLRFYDTGVAPKKNVDVMHEVLEEVRKEGLLKESKESKKRGAEEGIFDYGHLSEFSEEAPKKKRKSKKKEAEEDTAMEVEAPAQEQEKKKKKKKRAE